MGIKETLEYIHSVKWQGSKPGLERTRKLLEALGNPEKQLKFVHVAGTNGKGSTCALITAVLEKAGYRTGLYTSPYITCFNERMQVSGEFISDGELIQKTQEIRPFADAMEDLPTEFEMITALAMKYFLYKGCDIVVLEVGMGGELDSTNVIDVPELAVITALGYDHVRELGPTIADIARAKAGVIKSGGDVLVYGGEQEVEDVFGRVSAERGAKLSKVDFSRIKDVNYSLEKIELDVEPYGILTLPLVGAYQPRNALTAITALEKLREKGYKISDENIAAGIASVRWPGRFEVLGQKPVFILDGGHNPQGMEAAAESLRLHFGDMPSRGKVTFIVGIMADKDIDSMMAKIAPLAEYFIAVKPNNPRAMGAQELAEKLSCFGVPVITCGSVSDGVKEAFNRAGKGGIICALGSLYFSASIRSAYTDFTGGK
jgi:dihydrofolate synthase/folylpolyglutamate synthase